MHTMFLLIFRNHEADKQSSSFINKRTPEIKRKGRGLINTLGGFESDDESAIQYNIT